MFKRKRLLYFKTSSGQITHKDVAANGTSGTAISVTHEFTPDIGDLVFVFINVNGSDVTITDNNGTEPYTLIDYYVPTSIPTFSLALYYRIWTGDEASTIDFTNGADDRWGIAALLYSPAAGQSFAADPVDIIGVYNDEEDQDAPSAAAVEVASAASMAIAISTLDSLGRIQDGWPADGYTTRVTDLAAGQSIAVSDKPVGAGTQGSVSWTTDISTTDCTSVQVILKPSVAAGGTISYGQAAETDLAQAITPLGAPTLEQSAFGFFEDGTYGSLIIDGSQDNGITLGPSINRTLVHQIQAVNDPATIQYKLQVRKVGDADSEWEDLA